MNAKKKHSYIKSIVDAYELWDDYDPLRILLLFSGVGGIARGSGLVCEEALVIAFEVIPYMDYRDIKEECSRVFCEGYVRPHKN